MPEARTSSSVSSSVTVPVQRITNDVVSLTSATQSFLRARTLVLIARKMKPKTSLHCYLGNTNVDSWFIPCTRLVIPLDAPAFIGYQDGNKETNNVSARTTYVNSYDVLDLGDVITQQSSGASAVCIADELIQDANGAAKRVLYVANVKGTFVADAVIQGRSSAHTVSTTPSAIESSLLVDGSTSQPVTDFAAVYNNRSAYRKTDTAIKTDSKGAIYGVLIIPSLTFQGGFNQVSFNDTQSPDPSNASTSASALYASHGTINTFSRTYNIEKTNYTTVTNTTTTTITEGETVVGDIPTEDAPVV